MPGCILHVIGEEFDPHPFLATGSLQPYEVFRKGDAFTSKRVHDTGGFKCEVSAHDGDLVAEVGDAIAFLKLHYDDLVRLRSVPGVEVIYLDFGYYSRLSEQVLVQCDRLPPELLKLAGELSIAIELSLYSREGDS